MSCQQLQAMGLLLARLGGVVYLQREAPAVCSLRQQDKQYLGCKVTKEPEWGSHHPQEQQQRQMLKGSKGSLHGV
jgi:hypothetical protein